MKYTSRAKDSKDVWRYGAVVSMQGWYAVVVCDDEINTYEVDESTICKCTTRQDQNRKPVYENDILRVDGDLWLCEWDARCLQWVLRGRRRMTPLGSVHAAEMLVVGNKFDNPELGSWEIEY